MNKTDLIKRLLGVSGADHTPENISEITTLIDQYDRSAAKEAAVASKSSAYLFRDAQPYSEELEAKFLGAVLLNGSAAMLKVGNYFREGLFFLPAHEWVANAIVSLFSKSVQVTVQNVVEELRNTTYEETNVLEKIGGSYFVEDLVFGVVSWEEAEQYGPSLLAYWVKRKVIDMASVLIRKMAGAKVDEVNEVRAAFMIDMQNLAKSLDLAYGVFTADDLSRLFLERVSTLYDKKKDAKPGELVLLGVSSGIRELDQLTGGWQPDRLIIIQARPGMGKTGYILSEIITALDSGESILVFSLEMSALDLVIRLCAMMEYIDTNDIRTGNISDLDMQQAHAFLSWLEDKGIFIMDKPGLDISVIREISLTYRAQENISRIYLDYLQLAKDRSSSGNRTNEVSSITRGLKNITKEVGAPLIALSQLSRAVEIRGGTKRPQLSDGRESGEIEQAADVVISLYRPEYYQILEDEEGQSLKGIGEILVQKHRNGPVKDIRARFESSSRWVDIDRTDDLKEGDLFANPVIDRIPPQPVDDSDLPWD